MASVVYTETQTHLASLSYTESQTHPERRPLSIRLDIAPSSSPFPSPSSSFLPPPMPGAHEFAVKPAPAGRNGRKASLVPKDEVAGSPTHPDATSPKSPDRLHVNGTTQQDRDSILSPTTPTLRDATLPTPAPPSPSQATTPTPTTAPLPRSPSPSTSGLTSPSILTSQQPPKTPTTPSSPSSSPVPLDTTPAPTPNRPAPPSPDVSRRISAISTGSGRSKTSWSSHPPSAAVSRANSTRKSSTGTSTSATPSRLSQQPQQQQLQQLSTSTKSPSGSPLPSPRTFAFTTTASPAAASAQGQGLVTLVGATQRTLVHVRDFAYARGDERFEGLGPDVPRANRVARLNRRLRGSVGSYESSEDGGEDDEGEGEGDAGVDAAWDRLRVGWGLDMGYVNGTGAGGPSQVEMDLNFGASADGEDEEGEDGEEEYIDAEVEEEEPLYPGLYRAMYTFKPEGTGEMALEEDQIVRVVGRGGGVGWAVVLDENADRPDKHALVPESYLEAVRLDWEDDEEERA